jgi:hypothetical protein
MFRGYLRSRCRLGLGIVRQQWLLLYVKLRHSVTFILALSLTPTLTLALTLTLDLGIPLEWIKKTDKIEEILSMAIANIACVKD